MNFLTNLRQFSTCHDLLPRGATLILGVSGGPDSVCLLHALHSLAPEFNWRLHVAHLDHQLRGAEAQADADFVCDLAQRWGLPYTIESRDVRGLARRHKLSLEEAARQVRYGFLLEVALAQHSDTIAVAHHADDQAESVLMHFLRGSGLSGLRGMLPKMLLEEYTRSVQTLREASKIYLVRPLLEMPRAAIDAYCAQYDLQPRVDSTNADTTYFRNRLRHELLPLLETYNPNIRSVLRRTARVIAADHEVLETHINFAWDMTILQETATAITFSLPLWREQPIGSQRAMLRRAIQHLRPPLRDINFVHVEEAIEILQRAVTGAQVTLPQNLLLEVSYDTFTLSPRDELNLPDWPLLPEGLASLPISVPGLTPLPESSWVVEATLVPWNAAASEPGAALAARVAADTLTAPPILRPRLSADRFHPQGMAAPVRLKDWMINAKVPRALRDHLSLLVSGDQIIWVPGYRVGQPFIVRSETKQILQLIFRKTEPSLYE